MTPEEQRELIRQRLMEQYNPDSAAIESARANAEASDRQADFLSGLSQLINAKANSRGANLQANNFDSMRQAAREKIAQAVSDRNQKISTEQAINSEMAGLDAAALAQQRFDFEKKKANQEADRAKKRLDIDQGKLDLDKKKAASEEQKRKLEGTPVEQAINKKFVDTYASEIIEGKAANTEKKLSQLREASKILGTEKNITGSIVGNTWDPLRKATLPRSVETQMMVEGVVQESLTDILGGAFAQREGEGVMRRTYDPAMPQEVNKKNIDRLIKQLEAADKAKKEAIAYYHKHGSLNGYRGMMPEQAFHAAGGEDTSAPSGGSDLDALEAQIKQQMAKIQAELAK